MLMKPAKVPTWTKDFTLETYAKQLHTWSDILEDILEYIKYQDLIESLKTNKEVKGLPRYVGEHVLPTLEKKHARKRDKETKRQSRERKRERGKERDKATK